MRQIGTLPDRNQASRFAAYLIKEEISCEAEEEDSGDWSIWVHDENAIDEARSKFAEFKEDPDAAKYDGHQAQADEIFRQEQPREVASEAQPANSEGADPRKRWAQPPGSKAPFIGTLIILSVAVTALVGLNRRLTPDGLQAQVRSHMSIVAEEHYAVESDSLASVKRGQLWRLVTPIFPHLDMVHLIFNMFMLYQFGRLLELKLGAPKLALLVLVVAVISNAAQASTPDALTEVMGGRVNFFGMSGVVYGLFGYAWIRSQLDKTAGYVIPPMLVVLMLGWLVVCMTPYSEQSVANMAHLAGLFAGVLAAQVR